LRLQRTERATQRALGLEITGEVLSIGWRSSLFVQADGTAPE
jgi:hypothetical protein